MTRNPITPEAQVENGKCRKCGAEIVWLRTKASRALIPLNALPDKKGNVVIDAEGLAVVVGGGLFDDTPEGERYMPHHATCPSAPEFRRKK
jgi:hypothetical protein